MLALTAAASGSGGNRAIPLLVLGVLIVIVVVAIVRLRPKLRERRHEAWRRAGLLPDQIDPAPRPEDQDRPG